MLTYKQGSYKALIIGGLSSCKRLGALGDVLGNLPEYNSGEGVVRVESAVIAFIRRANHALAASGSKSFAFAILRASQKPNFESISV